MAKFRSAITISLVREARGGPFMLWEELPVSIAHAAELGFDAVEIFVPSAEVIQPDSWRKQLVARNLDLAAIGTGAGWLLHHWSLTNPDPSVRKQAQRFIAGIIERAAELKCPAIIGSMQGRIESLVNRTQALSWLHEALEHLGQYAAKMGVPLLFEPLNRYETNLINSVREGVEFLHTLETKNVRLLADLFHMNIEEVSIVDSIRAAGALIGHVHVADSNRRAAGQGHTDFAAVAAALREIGYSGFVSAEALPWPNTDKAPALAMAGFRQFFSERQKD